MKKNLGFLCGFSIAVSCSVGFCIDPMAESVVVASPGNDFPAFLVMSPGDRKSRPPRTVCYQVDDNGNFHTKWKIDGLYQRSDVYLGPWGTVLAKIVKQEKQLNGEEPMVELYKNGKLFKKHLVKDFFKAPDMVPIFVVNNSACVSTAEFRKPDEVPRFVALGDLHDSPGFYEFPRFREFRDKYVFTFVTTVERERVILNIDDGSILARWKLISVEK